MNTYSVTSSVLLLRAQNGSGTLSSVQRRLASDDSLALSPTAVGAASNLRDGIPIHYVRFLYSLFCGGVVVWRMR